jgi:hypothetical protein
MTACASHPPLCALLLSLVTARFTSRFQSVQEDDVIGIMVSDDIADLKPLGDRLLVEVSHTPVLIS